MTVRELMQKLEQFPGDFQVVIGYDSICFSSVDAVFKFDDPSTTVCIAEKGCDV